MQSKMNQKKGVILWDIDGTIISPIRKIDSSPHLNTVVKHGIKPNMRSKSLIGSTDYEVLVELTKKYNGINKFSILSKCFKDLDQESLVVYGKDAFELCLGISEALYETNKLGWDNGVLTGNTDTRLSIKISNYKFNFNSDLFFGCKFGDSREKITERASEMLRSKGINRILIIGDTPRDISVAKKFDLQVVSVATGKFSVGELKKFNPNLVIKNFKEDLDKFLKFIDNFK
jgi:phosphoglycolate phosphatase